jgi:hypothetical protein
MPSTTCAPLLRIPLNREQFTWGDAQGIANAGGAFGVEQLKGVSLEAADSPERDARLLRQVSGLEIAFCHQLIEVAFQPQLGHWVPVWTDLSVPGLASPVVQIHLYTGVQVLGRFGLPGRPGDR